MKTQISINNKLFKKITEFCNINNIDNINEYIENIIKKQFYIDCYGLLQDDIKPNISIKAKVISNDSESQPEQLKEVNEEPIMSNSETKIEEHIENKKDIDNTNLNKPKTKKTVLK